MNKTEILIIGQGLAGTLLAFELYKNKIDFRIIASAEKSRASEIAAGMVNPLVFKRLTKSWLVDDLLPIMDITYTELENSLNTKFLFKKDILKPLSHQEKQLWIEKQETDNFSKYISTIYNDSPVSGVTKTPGYGQVTGSAFVDLKNFLDASNRFFQDKGLLTEEIFDYSKLNISTEKISYGNFNTSKIVFCEGYHIINNPLFKFIKLAPTKGELLIIRSTDLSEKYILNKKVFVLPIGRHLFKVGSTYDWSDLNEEPTNKGRSSIIERLDNLIYTEYSIEQHFAGIRPTVSDRRPILGFHPEFKNVAVFNGLGTKGVMIAPYLAKEMHKLLTINNYQQNSEIHIKRFLKSPQ